MQYKVSGSNTQAPAATYPSQSHMSQTRSVGTKAPTTERTCFHCRSPGHMIANCPLRNPMQAPTNPTARPAVSGAGRVETQGSIQPRRINQSFGRGRVSHVTAQDAEETPEVVLGKFIANSPLQQYYLIRELRIRLYLQSLLLSIKYLWYP